MTDNIYKKMLTATDKIQTVAKNLSVSLGKSSYKAVGELDILNAVKPIEVECGIYSYPYSRSVIDTMTIETEYNGNVKKQLFMRIETVYRFVNADNPDEYVEVTSYGDGIDSGDKATGKAMTYCDKYALMKAYKISTGDDPDQQASENLKGVGKGSKPTPKPVNNEKMQLLSELKKFINQYNDEFKKIVTITMKQNNTDRVSDLPIDKLKDLVEIAVQGKNTFGGE